MRIAIMPARGGSKRIERKNIAPFCGRPLLTYPLEAARNAGLFDLIHVSTEDEAIAAVAAQHGFPPDFLRDPALADDHTPLLPVLKWVLERYAERDQHFETVCLLMPTAPLILPGDLSSACAQFESPGERAPVLAVTPMPCPVEWAMRLGADDRLTPIEPSKAEIRSQDLPKAYIDSGTFIFFSATQILAYPAPRPDYRAYVLPRYRAVDIDDRDDFEMAERLYRGRPA
jgi:CMP-N-acetylneuraminic acid synthetase